jgi:hypothetical protein
MTNNLKYSLLAITETREILLISRKSIDYKNIAIYM